MRGFTTIRAVLNDTIAAIATPLGEGGLAIVRVSGKEALVAADRCFRPAGKSVCLSAAESHTVHYGHIMARGQTVDEVLVTVLRAPRSFTREDTVEISCHGGPLPAKLVLDAVLDAGARLAEPGEFTRRAFLNGRLDLTQAEAVADIISSHSELALAVANEQLAGRLSRRIDEIRECLLRVTAHVEAHIDFPDEDIAPNTRDQMIKELDHRVTEMNELLVNANAGQVLRHGIRAAIVGRPNVGKSSLLNRLLGRNRAIVSPLPGTTRDTIAETVNLRGFPVVLVDTAGLRVSSDSIESEGVRRSREAASVADLILHVVDASQPLVAEDESYLAEFAGRRRVLVCNKSDLPARLEFVPSPGTAMVRVSCLTGEGIESLTETIKSLVCKGSLSAGMIELMINSRHENALRRADQATSQALAGLRQDISLEFVAVDLRAAVNALGEVVGKTFTEDLLDTIFSQFCLGK